MILLIHQDETVTEIIDLNTNKQIISSIEKPIKALFHQAKNNREGILVWCHQSQKKNLNIEGVRASFQLKNMMLSYSKNQYIPEQIGYVEDSPFLKINKGVKYPTWLMSSNVGAIHASQLLKFENKINLNKSFDLVLNSIAKLGMPNGMFCYSEPKLLIDNSNNNTKIQASVFQLFKFVKQHYKSVWSFLLLINFIIHEQKIPILSFLRIVFIKKIDAFIGFSMLLIICLLVFKSIISVTVSS
jgi:hypothetical protein